MKRFTNEIKVGNYSTGVKAEVSFNYKEYDTKISSLEVTVAQIDQTCDTVTSLLYLNVKDRPKVEVQLNYSQEWIDKKEVWANDQTGGIMLTLWASKIDEVPTSGTYKIENAKVKFSYGNLSLSTNSQTIIKAIEDITKQIEPSEVPSSMSTKMIKLPADRIQNVSCRYFCHHCKNFRESTCHNSNIFVCSECKGSSITTRMKKKYQAILQISEGDDDYVTVKLAGPQLDQYFRKQHGISIPSSLDDIAIALLQDSSTTLIYDNRRNCIGFQNSSA